MGNNDSSGTAGPNIIVSANRALQFGVGTSFSSSNGGTFTSYLHVGGDGNIGINTTGPLHKLHITQAADGNYPTLGTGKGALFIAGDTNLYGMYFGVNTVSGDGFIQTMRNNTATAYNLILNSAGGNVGIGTTNPGQLLHVNGNLQITGDSVPIGSGLTMGVVNASYRWIQSFQSQPLYVNPLGNNVIFNRDGGSVGIGTTSPGSKLDVRETLSTSTWTRIISRDTSNTAAAFVGVFRNSSTYSPGIFAHSGNLDSWANLWINAHNDGSGGIAGGTAFNVIIGGKVGIGTTSPASLLNIHGANSEMIINNTSFGNGGLKIRYNNSTTHGLNLTYTPNDATAYIDNTYQVNAGTVYGDIYFRQNVGGTMTTRMTIKADGGNVGIGTTNPAVLLHVGNASAASELLRLHVSYDASRNVRGGFTWHDGSNITGRIATEYDGSMVSMRFTSLYNSGYNSNDLMIIRGNGNVGIGTTTPGYKLEVNGNSMFRDTMYMDNAINFLRGDNSYTNFIRAQNHPDQGYTGSAQKFWVELGSYGGVHVTLNMDGSGGDGENGFDHFTVWQAASNSTSGSRQFYVSNIGNVWARNNITAYSDERVKKNWKSFSSDFVEKLSRVKSGTYERIDVQNVIQDGVSAQSLREVMPNSVTDNNGQLSIAYGNAALVSSIELAKQVVRLKQEIQELKDLIKRGL
jgi:hypothetical protein